jgi:hypothetical protein
MASPSANAPCAGVIDELYKKAFDWPKFRRDDGGCDHTLLKRHTIRARVTMVRVVCQEPALAHPEIRLNAWRALPEPWGHAPSMNAEFDRPAAPLGCLDCGEPARIEKTA